MKGLQASIYMEQSIAMDGIKKAIFNTPLLRVLDILMQYPNVELSDSEITAKVEGVRRSAVHQSLVRLAGMGVLKRTHRGRRCFNALDPGHAWLHHLKLAGDILELAPLVEQLKGHSSRVVLFGSRAEGTARYDSDFDVVVVTSEPETVNRIAAGSDLSGRLQLVAKTPSEMLDLDSREPVFAANIRKGVVLWER